MKGRWIIFCLSFLLIFAVQAQDGANWTILHYTDVDNNLEGAAFNDYYEMQSVGSGNGVNIVGEFDRAEGFENRFGDWTDTRRFLVEYVEPLPPQTIEQKRAAVVAFFVAQGADEADIQQEVDSVDDATIERVYNNYNLGVTFEQNPVQELGEVDMGDAQALLDFIVWGVQNYPANHYMLVIGSHGAGWRGIGPDDGAGESILTLPEIDAALTEARSELGIEKFDIIGFDACLMAVTDVALALEPHADYVLFSQEVIPSNGWEYFHSITAMQANPDWDAFQVGADFVDNYMEYYAGEGARTKVGLSLVETAALPNLLASLQDFADVVNADPVELLSALGTARNNSQAFGTSLGNRAEFYSYIDLRDFMNWFSLQTTITEDAYNAAQGVIAAYDDTVVYALSDSKLPNAHGLGIYLPPTPQSYEAFGADYPSSAPASFAFWQDYLNGFYSTIATELDGSALQLNVTSVFTLGEAGSIVDTPVISFDAAGLGVVDMSYYIFYQNDDGSSVIVDTSPISYNSYLPSGEMIVEYPNELTPSTFTWTVQMPILSDGTNSVLALLQSSSSGGSEGVIQGTYVNAQGNQPAYLVYDVTTMEFLGILAIADDAPYQVQPLPGDQFVVDLFSISPDGEVITQPQVDAPLTFGANPFSLSYLPVPSGNYRIGLSISDLAGNVLRARADVAINNEGLDGSLMGYTDINEGVYFQYPYAWGSSYVINNDDGSITTAVGDVTGENSIYVDALYDTDAETALTTMLGYFDTDAEISTLSFGGLDAYAAEFDAETDAGSIHTVIVSVFNEASGSAIVFTVQGDNAYELLDLIDSTLLLFEPQ